MKKGLKRPCTHAHGQDLRCRADLQNQYWLPGANNSICFFMGHEYSIIEIAGRKKLFFCRDYPRPHCPGARKNINFKLKQKMIKSADAKFH